MPTVDDQSQSFLMESSSSFLYQSISRPTGLSESLSIKPVRTSSTRTTTSEEEGCMAFSSLQNRRMPLLKERLWLSHHSARTARPSSAAFSSMQLCVSRSYAILLGSRRRKERVWARPRSRSSRRRQLRSRRHRKSKETRSPQE